MTTLGVGKSIKCDTMDVNVMRKQYQARWRRNLREVTVKVINNQSAGDYFNLGESPDCVETVVYLNINGLESDFTDDKEFSNVKASKYHVYSLYNFNIAEGDFLVFDGLVYKVKESSLNVSQYNGNIIFKDFDIFYIHDESN